VSCFIPDVVFRTPEVMTMIDRSARKKVKAPVCCQSFSSALIKKRPCKIEPLITGFRNGVTELNRNDLADRFEVGRRIQDLERLARGSTKKGASFGRTNLLLELSILAGVDVRLLDNCLGVVETWDAADYRRMAENRCTWQHVRLLECVSDLETRARLLDDTILSRLDAKQLASRVLRTIPKARSGNAKRRLVRDICRQP
jgi:hypothetical protein